MMTGKIKLNIWLMAGYMLGAGITIFPAYQLYQALVPVDKNNELTKLSKTRLAELAQQLQLVSLQIHRLQAELVLGRQLYRQKNFKDKSTTYLGQSVTNQKELLGVLRDKWSRLQNSKASRNTLQAQQNNPENENTNTLEFAENDSRGGDDASLMQYLQQPGPDVYVYWPTRDAYFIMMTATSNKPIAQDVTEFLQQTPLPQFIISLAVNSQQRVIDKLRLHTHLNVKVRQVLQQYYFLDYWQTDDGHTAWLMRVNLEGPEGLSAALLPIELAQLRTDSHLLIAKPTDGNAIKTEYSAVIFDLRRLSIKPGLFPRIITPAGDSVYTVSQTDPNRISQNGNMAYSASLATLRSMFGAKTLSVSVQEVRGPYGLDWVISEADASKIITANQRNGLFYEGRMGALLPNGYQ